MKISQIEMVSSLCGHCAKSHFHTLGQSENSRECHDLAQNFQRSMWLSLTSARRKLIKIREQSTSNEEIGRNENHEPTNETKMNSQHPLANEYHKKSDQSLQCFKTSSGKSEPERCCCCLSIRNGASVSLEKSRKMNGLLNNDVNTSYSNGALDGRLQCMRSLEMQVTPSTATTTHTNANTTMTTETLQPISISSSTLRCAQCHHMHTSAPDSSGQPHNLNKNVHDYGNPSNLSEKNERLTTDCSDLNDPSVEKNGIYPNGMSRGVRTFSVNYTKNQPRKHAYVNHRWPYAISSTMNYSHVLLICIAFIAFGLRSALVLAADDTPANATQLNTTESGSK